MIDRSEMQHIASERIGILFREAGKAAREHNLARASRYIFLARKLAMKFAVKLTREQRRKFCHKCYKFLQPGRNVSIQTNKKTKAVEYNCKECGHINRFPYIKEKSKTK
ncbi:MAG: ribonuclease P [DPANN group archaeon]|nr:ribonuclease P [DPANN group archaeon]